MINRNDVIMMIDTETTNDLDCPFVYDAGYQIFTLDGNGNPVAGVVFNVCTEESCTTYTTNEMGGIYFPAPPRRYHIQLVSAPNGLTVSGPDEWITEPYPQNIYVTFAD